MNETPELDDLLKDFLIESHENLDQADQDFIALEQNPRDTDILDNIFRTIRTIKGSCGFLGFDRMEALSHTGETLLEDLRSGTLVVTAEMTTALLDMVDRVREALGTIEATGAEGDPDYSDLVATLKRLQGGAEPPVETGSETESAGIDGDIPEEEAAEPTASEADSDDFVKEFLTSGFQSLDEMDQKFLALENNPADTDSLSGVLRAVQGIKEGCGFMGLAQLEALALAGETLLENLLSGTVQMTDEILAALVDTASMAGEAFATIEATGKEPDQDYGSLIATLERFSVEPPFDVPEKKPADPPAPVSRPEAREPSNGQSARQTRSSSIADDIVRVDVHLLDTLMNQVGELVLSRNQILQYMDGVEDKTLAGMAQRLNLITSELQESMMLTRLQPIDTIWSKLPRVVRDLSLELGKKVNFKMEGADTELDKTLIDAIRDPMTHLVRNAVDHGIEMPEVREAAGKLPEGTILLRAYHEGGQVNIEISEDGKGLDVEELQERALERNLIPPEQLRNMSDREKLELICLPGFSTAEKVTNISGRGVGMDVVKSNIERINGLIEIQSEPGKWTRIKVKIPLTLAIMPALMVSCEGDRYAIPQVSLIAVVRLEGESVRTGIETLHNAPVYRWRGRLLPLVYLRRELELEEPGISDASEAINIVVLQAEGRLFGLIVDGVHDSGEIVVKPLGRHLGRISAYAGATIMGDGKTALILDVLGLAQNAEVVSGAGGKQLVEEDIPDLEEAVEKQLILLVQNQEERMAIPIQKVPRLEKFPVSDVERSGDHLVVQYRDSIMPLRFMGQSEPRWRRDSSDGDGKEVLNVVVHVEDGHSVGLVVDRILDIVEEHLVIQDEGTRQPGVLGTAVVQNRVAQVVDIEYFTAL